jgi:transcription elongation GreA/GreB family factor
VLLQLVMKMGRSRRVLSKLFNLTNLNIQCRLKSGKDHAQRVTHGKDDRMLDKKQLFQALILALQAKITETEQLLGITHKTINEAPGAMQSHSDTTRYQSTAVANEQTRYLAAVQVALTEIGFFIATQTETSNDAVGLGAVVSIEENGEEFHLIVLPTGGGHEVEFNGKEFTVTTPAAPIYREIAGRKAGETIRFPGVRRQRELKIVAIA